MTVSELIDRLSAMPEDAEVKVMLENAFIMPASRVRWMRSQATRVLPGGVVEIDPEKGIDEAVIVCRVPEATDA
jgi:translation initiation factor IF-1